jgi:hypothetical protein
MGLGVLTFVVYDDARLVVDDAERVSSLSSSVGHSVGLSRPRSGEVMAHHLAVDGVYLRALSFVWKEQDRFGDGLRSLLDRLACRRRQPRRMV